MPVIAYDGSTMKQINASDILDITMAGASATLLVCRWESALLVNVDNDTLSRLMASEKAMQALMNIEGFRSLNNDIETIITLSEKKNLSQKWKWTYRALKLVLPLNTNLLAAEKFSDLNRG